MRFFIFFSSSALPDSPFLWTTLFSSGFLSEERRLGALTEPQKTLAFTYNSSENNGLRGSEEIKRCLKQEQKGRWEIVVMMEVLLSIIAEVLIQTY